MLRCMAIMITAAAAALIASQAAAQQTFGFAYYDIDRLYDTIPSPFGNDSDYTPDGRLKWNGERYRRKVEAVAAVIDSMAMPVTALFGVENEQVVRDIVSCCKGGYSYLHRTSDRFDGLDFALLYYGDLLFPLKTESGRSYMKVEAQLSGGTKAVFILAKKARNMEAVIAQALAQDPQTTVVAAGEFEANGLAGMGDALHDVERSGHGNVLYADGWKMADRIAAANGVILRAGVYARRHLLDRRGAPRPTYRRNMYAGGAGKRLPVWCIVETKTGAAARADEDNLRTGIYIDTK